MKAWVIAVNSVRRLFRDRTNIFFVFLMPVILILAIGVVFGGSFEPRIAVVASDAGPLGEELVDALSRLDGVRIERFETEDEIAEQLERANLEAGVVIPAGYDTTLRQGGTADLRYLATPSSGGIEIQSLVGAEIAAQAAEVRAARFVSAETGMGFESALAAARAAEAMVEGVTLEVVGGDGGTAIGQFDLGAAQNLVLWVFITSLAGSAALIQSRRLGVSRRMLSTPTASAEVIAGEGLGRFAVAMVQGLFIVLVAAVAFGVGWGDPLGAGALVIMLSLVGAGGGMLLGSTFSNDEQAGGIGVFLALGLGALGGCMVPLEIFPPTMVTIAHLTPHAWALDGFAALIRDDAGLGQILPEVGVLFAFGVGLLLLSSYLFRRTLTH